MRNIILASHGSLADGMLSAARMIIGDCSDIEAYSLDHYDCPQTIYELICEKISNDRTEEYVILCDINGGSVHNQLMHLMERRNVYMIVGMTLSMVLELKLAEENQPTLPLLEKIIASAKENTLLFDYDTVREKISKETEEEELW